MKKQFIIHTTVLVFALLSQAGPGFAGQMECEIPFRFEGHLIVVEASIGSANGLRFMIDTAATGSVIDKKAVKKLGLEPLPGYSQIVALGRITEANRFHIPMLRIGPVYTELYCLEADLSGLGVDGVLGADFLRQEIPLVSCATNEIVQTGSFTIDFKARKLFFGLRQQLKNTTPLMASNPGIIVEARIQGDPLRHPLRLAVDTGSYTIVLYKESKLGWLANRVSFQKSKFYRLGGTSPGKELTLPGIELGSSRWQGLSGVLFDLPDQPRDGILPVKPLGMKVLHFDFVRNLMSWTK